MNRPMELDAARLLARVAEQIPAALRMDEDFKNLCVVLRSGEVVRERFVGRRYVALSPFLDRSVRFGGNSLQYAPFQENHSHATDDFRAKGFSGKHPFLSQPLCGHSRCSEKQQRLFGGWQRLKCISQIDQGRA